MVSPCTRGAVSAVPHAGRRPRREPRGPGLRLPPTSTPPIVVPSGIALAEVLHEQHAIFAVVVGRRSALTRVDLLYRLTERLSGKRSSVSP